MASVTLSMREYERMKESVAIAERDLNFAYDKIHRMEEIFKKIGIPLNVIRDVTPDDVVIYEVFDIDLGVQKYRIDIRVPANRVKNN